MYFSVWHRSRSTGTWALVSLKGSLDAALAEYERLRCDYRSGQIRCVDPAGIILRRCSCRREPVAVA